MIWKFCLHYCIYLLNYTAEVLGISLAVVFHLTSSKSVFIFCCTNMSKNSSVKFKYYLKFTILIQNLFSKFQISKKNFQIFSTFVIMVGFEPTQPRVTYFLSLTLSRNFLTFSAVTWQHIQSASHNHYYCWIYGTRTHNRRTKIFRVTITPRSNL